MSILYSLAALVVAPIIAYLSMRGESIPRWCWPFLTHDNTIDGDHGHWNRWPDDGTRSRVFMRRTAWLWRNKAYNYDFYINGEVTTSKVYVLKGHDFWKDANPRGLCYAKCGNAWMIFAWYPYTIFGYKRGLRIYLGWKLRNKIDNDSETRAMLVTHINPFKGKI